MKTEFYSLDDFTVSNASLELYFSDNSESNNLKRERMSKLLKIAFDKELTQRQRDCVTMYYVKNKKVNEIAKIMSIQPSTVYKHIRAGMKSLKKAAVYL